MKKTFDVVIEKDEDGWFIADVPSLPGCHTQGETKEDVLKNIKEAILLYLEVVEEKKIKERKNSSLQNTFIEKVSVYA